MEHLEITELITTYVIPWGIRLIWALVIFIAGRAAVSIIVGLVRTFMRSRELDEILASFLLSILRSALLLFVVIASLNQLGVDTTSLVALLGAAGLAVGLALQGSLANFAAGVMLIIFRPFSKGDFVEVSGTSGMVDDISIFTTTLTTADNKEVIIPNGNITADTITNYSARDTRRVDMVFGIGYDDDLKQAKKILEDIIANDERVLAEPAPTVALSELADSSVNFIVRPWVKAEDYWGLKFDVTEAVKLKFDEADIGIPYPQMDIHLPSKE